VRLTVTDDDGATDQASRQVTVVRPNDPPNASFTWVCSGRDCDFTDTSTDPDGTIASWSWTFGDGSSSSQRNPSHLYAVAGVYDVTLEVTDDKGATDATTVSITANEAPVADFAWSCNGTVCSFTDRSTDADGVVEGWQWDFGDGTGSTLQNPTHDYGNRGSRIVTLTVTDDLGSTGTTSQDVKP
jgi:PKD repeat protein